MAILGTATVTPVGERKLQIMAGANRRRSKVSIVFGNATDTYPAGGVPLPSKLGIFPRSLDSVNLYDTSNDGFNYKYDGTNNRVKMFHPGATTVVGVEFTSADKPALNVTIYADAWGS